MKFDCARLSLSSETISTYAHGMWAAHVNGVPTRVPSIARAPHHRPVVHACARSQSTATGLARISTRVTCAARPLGTVVADANRFDRSMFFVVHQGKAAKARSRRRATGKTTAVVPKTTRTKRRKKKKVCPADRPGRRLGRRCRRARTPNRTPSTNVYRHSGQ